ncbi:MAG TPA: hypothetical protein VGG06_20700 [Thermoanaerobaculia bacterium]
MTDLVASADPLHVAYGHNYLFEERVSPARQGAYENGLDLPAADLKSWKHEHRGYLHRSVWVGRGQVPETFRADNAEALLAGLDEEQRVVRVERLDGVLVSIGTDLPTVEAQLAAFRRGTARSRDASAFLERLCLHWNQDLRPQDRPTFGAFLDDVETEIEAPDWANRLRNRLGLSHYHVPAGGARIPVALVSYRVAEVIAAAGGDALRAFSVPTVLDGELNAHFFPAPSGVGYGRTLGLEPDPECERLVAEVLHRRIDYTPDHLLKVGWVTTPIPPYASGAALARLRNGHLSCLRYESHQDDFGEDIQEERDG